MNKISYLKKRLIDLKQRGQKLIIFSQFLNHPMLVSIELKKSQFKHNYAELYPNRRDVSAARNADKHFGRELDRFQHDHDCFILVMGAHRGAVALDISFVHHIILMEPIWDGSLEKPVVARAHLCMWKDR